LTLATLGLKDHDFIEINDDGPLLAEIEKGTLRQPTSKEEFKLQHNIEASLHSEGTPSSGGAPPDR